MSQFPAAALGREKSRCRPRRRGGFTLVELLVVIGIIAVLISILLPTLSSARRSANGVKCLASLREIGNAFRLYAVDNHGYYPAVRDSVQQAAGTEHRWTDMIAPMISKQAKNFSTVGDITKLRLNSVLWGCPEWTKTTDYSPTSYADQVYNGYGMQYYPDMPNSYKSETNAFRSTAARTGYFKESLWTRHGAERIIVADSRLDYIQLPTAAITTGASYTGYTGFSGGTVKLQPWDKAPSWGADDFQIDCRHMKPGTKKSAALNMKCINALFCDGHATTVSPKEAFNAIRNPGQDSTK
jgi:prepilin-type N-terminal cleavage/methylation domain-containing protein/prepilin-type processing-associated H-X9-DG protein